MVLEVLEEYRAHLPMTARQMYYRLVGREVIAKTEAGYSQLCELLNRARRSGRIGWQDIRDDGTTEQLPFGYPSIESVISSIRYRLGNVQLDFDPGVEVWVEAAGMVPMVARAVVDEYRVPVYSSGGFDSVTAKHSAARRMIRRDRPTVVLHVGDLDPSGRAVVDSAAEDVAAFCADYGKPGIVAFERVAVLPGHVDQFGLATAPAKKSDRRGGDMDATVQAEAFAPDQLVRLITSAVIEHVDLNELEEHREREIAARRELAERVAEIIQ